MTLLLLILTIIIHAGMDACWLMSKDSRYWWPNYSEVAHWLKLLLGLNLVILFAFLVPIVKDWYCCGTWHLIKKISYFCFIYCMMNHALFNYLWNWFTKYPWHYFGTSFIDRILNGNIITGYWPFKLFCLITSIIMLYN